MPDTQLATIEVIGIELAQLIFLFTFNLCHLRAMKSTNRRSLLKNSLLLSAPWIGWSSTASGGPPSKELRVASFGAAKRAWRDIEGITAVPNTTLVAVAEIDESHLKQVNKQFPKTKVYRDWRNLLEKESKNIDAIVVATPDHMHAPMAMSAMLAGFPVYCEKPLTRTLHEARALREFAEAKGLVTQMGNQRSQHENNRTTVKYLREGIVGTVREIHCMQNKQWGSMEPLPAPGEVPPGVDWDLWLGVRPERPWVDKMFHPFNWRGRLGFGCGNLGDMGCHIFHPWYLGLNPGAPLTAESFGPGPANPDSWPTGVLVKWEFAGSKTSGGKPFTVSWHDGGQPAPEHVVKAVGGPENAIGSGSIIIGTKGALISPHVSGKVRFFADGKEVEDAIEPFTEINDHYADFASAVRGDSGTKPLSHFGHAGPMTEAVLVGTYAVRTPGVKLEWDSANLRFTNSPEANLLVREPYRKGWEVEGL